MTKLSPLRFARILIPLALAAPVLGRGASEELTPTRAPAASAAPWVLLDERPGLRVRNESEVVLGTLRDHVVRARDGAVTHVVLETAARSVLVPWDRFLWPAERRDPVLTLGVAEVAALPAFDPEHWRPQRTTSDREQAARRPLRELLGTRLRAARVLAGSAPFGMVRQVILDPRGGRVGYALVWTGSDESLVVVPWTALKPRRSSRPDGRAVLSLAKRRAELTEAPRLAKDDLRALDDPALARAVHEFYGVTPSSESDTSIDNP